MTRLEYGTITEIEIESTEHFLELTNKFDWTHGTTTRIAYLTLKEIWYYFIASDHRDFRYWAETLEDYVDRIISSRIHNSFQDSDGFWSNADNADRSCMGKLNALDQMRQDINTSKGFIHPMSVLFLPNGTNPVHPGQTRLMFHEHYTERLPIIITMMPGAYGFGAPAIESIEYDFSGQGLSFKTGMTNDPHMPDIFNKAATFNDNLGHAYFVKEITDYLNTSKQVTYHKPEELDPPRYFERADNSILVDGNAIAVLDREKWRIVL